LRHHAELRQDVAGKAADPELEPVEVADVLDLLAEPAAHLAAGIARDQVDQIVLLGELVHQLEAVTVEEPGVLLARIEPERHGAEQREGRILADVVIGRGVTALDRSAAHRVGRLQAGDDLAGGEDLNLELVVGRLGDVFGEGLGGAVERVERLRKARGQAPFHLGRRLRDGGRGDRRGGEADAGGFEEFTTFHGRLPVWMMVYETPTSRIPAHGSTSPSAYT